MLRAISFFALLLVVNAIQFEISIYQDCETEWNKFQSTFKYDEELYGSRAQGLDRKAIFCERLEVIKAHNVRALAGDETYSKGVNDFTDWTIEEIASFARTRLSSNVTIEYDNEYVPEEFDPEATSDFRRKLPTAKNQGSCGSCWSFSAVSVIDFLMGGSHSEQQYVDCVKSSYGCDGGWADDALNWAKKYGADTESQYPYKGRDGSCKQSGRGTKLRSVSRVSGASGIKSAGLKTVVSTAINFSSKYNDDFGSYSSGIFSGRCGKPAGGHAIAVAGIQSGYYIIRNSWGTGWGMKGYMYMQSGSNICNMEKEDAYIATA